MNEIGGASSTYGESRGAHRILMGKPEGKRPLWRLMPGWEYNTKMCFQEMGCEGMDWIGLAKDRGMWWALVNAVMNLRIS